MSLVPWKEAWQLVVITQDRGLQLVLPLSCCFPMASQARSEAVMLVEAWADSECPGNSNTVVMNGRVDFLKKQLAH